MKSLLLYLTLCGIAAGQLASTFKPAGSNGEQVNQTPFITALGGTTAGKALFQMANPGAVRYLRINADNTVSQLDAASFLSGIGGGSGGAWGSITGTLSAQTDLNTALSGKVATTTLSTTGGASKVAQYDSNGDLNLGGTSTALVSISSQNNIVPSLDTAGSAAVAFGLQRLRSAYFGPCIKVRRSTDSAETDIGFAVDGSLNTAALLEFCCGGSGFIKTWYDQSGNARDLTQATTTKQFTLVASGVVSTLNGQPAALVTAANSQDMASASFSLSGATSATVFAGFSTTQVSGGNIVFDHGTPFSNGIRVNINQSLAARVEVAADTSGSAYLWNRTPAAFVANQALCISGVIDPAKSTASARIRIRQNGEDLAEAQGFQGGTLTSACFGNNVLKVGSNSSNGGLLDGRITAILIFPATLTSENIGAVESQVSRSLGIGTAWSSSPSARDFSYSATPADDYPQGLSSYSSASYTTRATTLKICAFNNIFAATPTWAKVGIFVDGAYFSEVTYTANGYGQQVAFLPAGTKTVQLVTAPQSRSGGAPNPVLGTWPISFSTNAPMTRVSVSSASSLLVYGDSIAAGDSSSPTFSGSWVQRLRAVAPYPVASETWGWRSLYEDCSDSTARAAFVAKIVARNPAKLWLAIGTNDYGLYPWTAANFGTAYAALLTDLNTALPSLVIYAQTPGPRSTETANAAGSTMVQYRAAIATAVSGKSYVTLVDGTTFYTTGDTGDGLHPTTAGHLLYFNAVKSVLGL